MNGLDIDIVHDHTRAGVLTAGSRRAPTLATVHGPLSGPGSQRREWEALGELVPLVAISEAQRQSAPGLRWVGTVHHGISVEDYPFSAKKEDFVLFLGRISPVKGITLAMTVARESGRPLVIGGTGTVPSERLYVEGTIRPMLGPNMHWLGEVETDAKRDLLSRASCLLFPVEWDEPFGVVMLEAMACGTPVVALRAGAVAELVVDGQTGIICDNPPELARGIEACARLDPARCRAHVADRFSVERMVRAYEAIYRAVLEDSAG